jgi:hypothetical protein
LLSCISAPAAIRSSALRFSIFSGNGGLDVDDAKVTVLKAPAKLPWSTPVVEEIRDPVLVRSILAEEADGVDIYATLPIELRFAALCLPLPPENSRRHDGQEAA